MPPTDEPENAEWNLFRAIMDQAGDAMIFADRDGAIRVWNRGAEAVVGYAAASAGPILVVIISHLSWQSIEGFGLVLRIN